MLDLKKPYVVNAWRTPKQVGIVRVADGAKGSTRVMGPGKVNVPDGYTIDRNWLALNGGGIKFVDPTENQNTQPAPAVSEATQTTAPTVTAETSATAPQATQDKGDK